MVLCSFGKKEVVSAVFCGQTDRGCMYWIFLGHANWLKTFLDDKQRTSI